jgi:hypothetical protein
MVRSAEAAEEAGVAFSMIGEEGGAMRKAVVYKTSGPLPEELQRDSLKRTELEAEAERRRQAEIAAHERAARAAAELQRAHTDQSRSAVEIVQVQRTRVRDKRTLADLQAAPPSTPSSAAPPPNALPSAGSKRPRGDDS